MADIVSPAVRSRMMAGIRGRDTKPELILRKGLHRRGFRYRLHAKELPGKPDLVFPKYRAVIFAHGCFWHGHECPIFKWPSTRADFWKAKIIGNKESDYRVRNNLLSNNWRVMIVWECALRARQNSAAETVIGKCAKWLHSNIKSAEISS
jgi:DNA mismatch endonuclease, patch repair protein